MKSDRDVVLDAIEAAQMILAEELEPGALQYPSINRLLMVLDRPELAAAQERLRGNRGLRMVK